MGAACLTRTTAAVAAIAWLVASCGPAALAGVAQPAGGGGGGGDVLAAGAQLALRELASGPMSHVETELTEVFRDAAAFAAFWQRHDPGTPAPAVDFAREMVAAVVLQRNTGGYAIAIDQATIAGGTIAVHVTEQRPPPDAITIQVLTQPWAAVALPLRPEPVTFTRSTR